MDIWEWVYDTERQLHEQGEHRLADAVSQIVDAVVEDDHTRVDALLPEALANARALENPWLEIFLRHWALQSRILYRMEGAPALAEAVSLVEFGHRIGHERCPQTVCAVQDLCACYGICDGPGYAPERIQVSIETLARIDPRWPCYQCISGEYTDALIDAGDLQRAEAVQQEHLTALREAGKTASDVLEESRTSLLFALGRPAEVMTLLDDLGERGELSVGKATRLNRKLQRARALAALGRDDEAREALPALDEVARTPKYFRPWFDAITPLMQRGAVPNDARNGGVLRQFARGLDRQGASSRAFQIATGAIRLTLARQRPAAAARDLELATALASRLRDPGRVAGDLEALAQAIARTAGPSMPEAANPADLLARLDGDDPELALEHLIVARRRWPEDADLARAEATTLLALGHHEAALAGVRALPAAALSDPASIDLLTRIHLGRDDQEALAALAAELQAAGQPVRAHEVLARLEQHRGRDQACMQHLRALLDAEPDRLGPRRLLVSLARKQRDWSTMLAQVEELMARSPDEGTHWDRVVAATVLGDWAKVRASAAALEWALEGEGPIDQPSGLVRVRFTDDRGATYSRYAVRTGPVTARVDEALPPPAPEHYGDVVVFEPVPLGEPDPTGEEPLEFPVLARLSAGGHRTYRIDGIHPGERAWQKLTSTLAAVNGVLQRRTDDNYKLRNPDTRRLCTGVVASLAVPDTLAPGDLHQILITQSSTFRHPLIWPDCARAAGDEPAAEAQGARWQQWTDATWADDDDE